MSIDSLRASQRYQQILNDPDPAKVIEFKKRRMLHKAKARAKKYGIPFTITVNDLTTPKRCPVFGIEFNWTSRVQISKSPNSPTLDRVIPEKGYVPGNVQIISYAANWLKGTGTLEEFKMIVKYIKKYSLTERS